MLRSWIDDLMMDDIGNVTVLSPNTIIVVITSSYLKGGWWFIYKQRCRIHENYLEVVEKVAYID